MEWFACVSQRSLTPACAQSYIATLSQLSHKLLDVVVNLQDAKVSNIMCTSYVLNSNSLLTRVTLLFILLRLMVTFLH